MDKLSPFIKETGVTKARRECVDIPAALGVQDRLDFVDWLERREYQDIQGQEVRQVLTDPPVLQVSRDTVATQATQVHQVSQEERESRENPDLQDLRCMLAMEAPLFKVNLVSQVFLGLLDPVVIKDLQASQAFQEPQELTQEQECVDCPVSQGPQGQRGRRAPQGSRATAPRARPVPPDCKDHQANPDHPDPLVQV